MKVRPCSSAWGGMCRLARQRPSSPRRKDLRPPRRSRRRRRSRSRRSCGRPICSRLSATNWPGADSVTVCAADWAAALTLAAAASGSGAGAARRGTGLGGRLGCRRLGCCRFARRSLAARRAVPCRLPSGAWLRWASAPAPVRRPWRAPAGVFVGAFSGAAGFFAVVVPSVAVVFGLLGALAITILRWFRVSS